VSHVALCDGLPAPALPERTEMSLMYRSILSLVIAAPFVSACGGSLPPPTQRMADAQSAERSARELGASSVPDAKLSLTLAQDEIAQGKLAIESGDNERADGLLKRAKADAELALARARENGAKVGGQEAVRDSVDQKTTNEVQGAVK
jgi:hypothetical protein